MIVNKMKPRGILYSKGPVFSLTVSLFLYPHLSFSLHVSLFSVFPVLKISLSLLLSFSLWISVFSSCSSVSLCVCMSIYFSLSITTSRSLSFFLCTLQHKRWNNKLIIYFQLNCRRSKFKFSFVETAIQRCPNPKKL
jgi:hypothetical protein